MEQRKLYVKDKCMVCRGKSYGSCPYCEVGETFVELSDKSMLRWFLSLSEERRIEILELLNNREEK